MIKLGDKVKDTITDFEGTVVAKIDYLNGCIRYEVKPQGLKDGKTIEAEWIDETQLIVIGKKKIRKNDDPGGPGDIPSKFSHP